MWSKLSRTFVVASIGLLVTSVAVLGQTPAARFEGRPTFSEGEALGYFVWRDGDTWKIRWTTFGAEHRFNGRVVVEGGEITSFKRVDVDEERRLIRPGSPGRVVRGPRGRVVGVNPGRAPVVAARTEDRIEQEDERRIFWQTTTDDDVDGLEFKVSGAAQVLRFVLEIDGVPRPAEVEIGRSNFKPNQNPVVATLR